jgi:hypothetical protein
VPRLSCSELNFEIILILIKGVHSSHKFAIPPYDRGQIDDFLDFSRISRLPFPCKVPISDSGQWAIWFVCIAPPKAFSITALKFVYCAQVTKKKGNKEAKMVKWNSVSGRQRMFRSRLSHE